MNPTPKGVALLQDARPADHRGEFRNHLDQMVWTILVATVIGSEKVERDVAGNAVAAFLIPL